MYKKLMLTVFVSLSLLVGLTGCDKKDGGNTPVPAEPTPPPSAGANNTVYAQAPANVEYGAGVNKTEANQVLGVLASKLPQVNASKIEKAPVPGFYQVLADGDVFYSSADGKFLFIGDVYSMQQSARVSLTEEVRKEARVAVIKSIPESDMVVYTPEGGKPEHTITVFTDIDCGYCRKFHREMKDYLAKNIKVRYMSFPRAGKGSESYNKAKSVWCSKDRNKAMDSAKLDSNFKADEKLCDNNAVDQSLDVVSKLGLRGTPALLLDDGSLLPGYMPADRLRATLDSFKKQAALSTSGGAIAPNAG